MSPPGRPKGEHRRAQPAGFPISPPGRPKGEHRRAQPAGFPTHAVVRLAASLAAGCLWGAPALAQTPNFAIDPTHTFVNYENGHYGTTTNRGRFSTKDGTLFFDRAAQQGKVEIIIDISSVNTGVDFLNRQIQGKDFFNVADFPTGTFVSDKFVFNGDKVSEVQGQLTLKGKTHPVALKATKFNCYVNPLFKREVCGGDFETNIIRSQWDILWGLQFGFEDAVKLIIQVEAIKMQ